MSDFLIWSAPNEPYEDHVRFCLGSWDRLNRRMLPSFGRLFETAENIADKAIRIMVLYHDIGKLTAPWQTYIQKPKAERKFGPPHATLGAAHLMGLDDRGLSEDLINSSALAILMHHTDSGLAQGNLEHPAEDAINRGIAIYGTEKIRWAVGAEEAFQKSHSYVPGRGEPQPLASTTITSLENMADKLRLWSRCPKELERHKHRIQALSIHHILKVCDWRAASFRPQIDPNRDEEGDDMPPAWRKSILSTYLSGGLLR